jgi:hypothetical protein
MEFIVKLCNIAKNLGFKPDPWLEALIEAYEETKNGFDYSQTAM